MENKTERLQTRVEPRFLAALDEWRRQESDLPSRMEAMRRLVELGLAAHAVGLTSVLESEEPEKIDRLREALRECEPHG
jgi:hypothetical protein